MEPSFSHHGKSDLPLIDAKGFKIRVLAGSAFGGTANVKTLSPMFYAHLELARDATVSLPDNMKERAAYVVSGSVDADGQSFHAGQMLVFGAGAPAVLKANETTTLMALGGEPLGPRFIEWNFVSSSKERIEQAKADWKAGRMKLPDLDNKEFTPLPDDRPPAG
jgi:redox-sensitive bicupin YhaK (pirin superfamily)